MSLLNLLITVFLPLAPAYGLPHPPPHLYERQRADTIASNGEADDEETSGSGSAEDGESALPDGLCKTLGSTASCGGAAAGAAIGGICLIVLLWWLWRKFCGAKRKAKLQPVPASQSSDASGAAIKEVAKAE